MSIHKDKKRNTWYVKYNNQTKRGFASKKEANEYEAKLKCGYKEEKPEFHLFYDVADDFLKNKKNETAYSTYKKSKEIITIYIKPLTKNKPIEKYDDLDCRAFKENLSKKDLATSYKNDILNHFKAIFKHASKYFGLKTNPIRYLDPFKKKFEEKIESKKREESIWTYEEFHSFIKEVTSEDYKIFFYILFFTGMRLGEALALSWKDFNNSKLSINKATCCVSENGELVIKDTKNVSSIREISLNASINEYLISYKEKQMKKEGYSDSWFIFGGIEPLKRTNIQRYKERAISKSGVKRITTHQFRHSHATNLINDGVNIVAVSRRLGHSDVGMTLRVYTHLFKKVDDELIDNLEKSSHNLLTSPKDDKS